MKCETCDKEFTATDCSDKRFCSIGCGDMWLRAEREAVKPHRYTNEENDHESINVR